MFHTQVKFISIQMAVPVPSMNSSFLSHIAQFNERFHGSIMIMNTPF